MTGDCVLSTEIADQESRDNMNYAASAKDLNGEMEISICDDWDTTDLTAAANKSLVVNGGIAFQRASG